MPLATIQKIISINPIANADNIEVAKVLGWDVVVKKEEFKPGDLCIYIEIDSLLPRKEWSEFLFKEGDDSTEYRLRTVKLRKQISQGLVLPIYIIPGVVDDDDIEVGANVTDLLEIKKYEHPIPGGSSGFKSGTRARFFPSFIPKTDEVRIQSAPNLLEELKGKPYYITMKMDGTSFTCYKYKGKFGVCSRNIEMASPLENRGEIFKYWLDKIKRFLHIGKPRKNPRTHDLGVYWEIAMKYNLEEILPEGYAIQGEICGNNIQKNKMGLDELKLYVFNLFDINKQQKLNPFSFGSLVLNYLQHYPLNFPNLVPFCEDGDNFNYTLEELIEMANELNYDNGTPAEGIVVRSLDQTISFKVVSNRFLLKYGE